MLLAWTRADFSLAIHSQLKFKRKTRMAANALENYPMDGMVLLFNLVRQRICSVICAVRLAPSGRSPGSAGPFF